MYVASSFSGSTATPAPTKRRSALFPSLEATTTKTTATVALLFFFHSWLDSFILGTSHLSFSLLDSLDVRTVSSFFFFFCHFTQCLPRYIFSSFCVFFLFTFKEEQMGPWPHRLINVFPPSPYLNCSRGFFYARALLFASFQTRVGRV